MFRASTAKPSHRSGIVQFPNTCFGVKMETDTVSKILAPEGTTVGTPTACSHAVIKGQNTGALEWRRNHHCLGVQCSAALLQTTKTTGRVCSAVTKMLRRQVPESQAHTQRSSTVVFNHIQSCSVHFRRTVKFITSPLFLLEMSHMEALRTGHWFTVGACVFICIWVQKSLCFSNINISVWLMTSCQYFPDMPASFFFLLPCPICLSMQPSVPC